jgi:hypothetical protein
VADSFQPDSFVPDTPVAAVAAGREKKSSTDSFQPDSFVPDGDTEPATGVYKEIQERGVFDRPLGEDQPVLDADIREIAAKEGVPYEKLRGALPFLGGKPENISWSDYLGRVGYTAALPLMGGAQKLYKMSQDDKTERAMDALQQLAAGRASYLTTGAEVAAPASMIGKSKKAAAAVGSVVGASNAPQGQELEGALLGAGLGIAAKAGEQLITRASREAATRTEQEVIRKTIQETPELDRGAQEILERRSESTHELFDFVSGQRDGLDSNISKLILREQVPVEVLTDSRTGLSKVLAEYYPESGEQLQQKLAGKVVEDRTIEFARHLNRQADVNSLTQARKVIQDYTERQGGVTALRNKWDVYQTEQAALEYLVRNPALRTTRGDNALDRVLNHMSDAQFVLRDISERYGVALEPAHQKLNRAYNRMSFARNDSRKALAGIFRKHKSIDQELTRGGRVYQALDTGDVSKLSEQEVAAYQDFQKYFSDQLNYVNKLVTEKDKSINPLSIPARPNYVPHMLAEIDRLQGGFETRMQQALRDATAKLGFEVSDISKLSSGELDTVRVSSRGMQELIEGLELLNNKKIETGSDIVLRYNELLNSPGRGIRLETAARAAMEREGSIPDWMREKNLFILADKWSTNTLRHLYLRNSLDEMASQSRRIRAAGGTLESDYIDRLLQDINGIRSGTVASYTLEKRLEYMRRLDARIARAKDPEKKLALQMAKAVPEVFSDLSKQIYPNLLGMSPRALIMNSTQLLTKTWPELGTVYGPTAIIRGLYNVATNYPQMRQRLTNSGFQPAEFTPKYRQAITEGIRRSSIYALPSNVVAKMGDVAMRMYTWMDSVNRMVSMSVADAMAHDLTIPKPSRLAQRTLTNFPTALQREVAGAGGDRAKISAILAGHLNASTQYNYNRASMSEFGRTMGPMFSIFSKWPTATVGEIVAEYRKRGVLGGSARNAEKFILPLLAFQAFDSAVTGEGFTPWNEDTDEKTDVQKKLLGVGGLSQSAPIGALKGISEGDFFTPPALDVVLSVVRGMAAGDGSAVMRGVDNAVNNFAPGSVWMRLITDDLVTFLEGERPEGNTFTERSIEGARILGK